MPSIRRHVSRYKVAPVQWPAECSSLSNSLGRADHQQVSQSKGSKSPGSLPCKETSMVALRTLLLQVAVASAGFGLSGAVAQTPKPSPPPAIAVTPNDQFGEQVTMTEKTIVYLEGSGQWDSAFETIVAALKSVYGAMEKLGAKPDGASMT